PFQAERRLDFVPELRSGWTGGPRVPRSSANDIINNKETRPPGVAAAARLIGDEACATPSRLPAGGTSDMATLREQIATNVLTMTKFRDLLHQMRENRPNDDLELIRKAYEFSQKNHSGQQRASGEPYLVHPLEVA